MSNANRLIVVGAGGHGKVVADAALLMQRWEEVVFIDDRYPMQEITTHLNVIGKITDCKEFISTATEFVVAIGDNQLRLSLSLNIEEAGGKLATVIHPSAVMSPFSQVEPGSAVLANAVVNPGAHIGKAAIVNSSAVIEHDVAIGDGAHIAPNASLAGQCQVGRCTLVGIGSSVKECVKLGNFVTVGAGAVVVRDIVDNVAAVGIPAKPI